MRYLLTKKKYISSNGDYLLNYLREKAEKFGVNETTKKPIPYETLKSQLGEESCLLMLTLLAENPNCSKAGAKAIISVMHGLLGDHEIRRCKIDESNKYLGFTLYTKGFLSDDLDNYPKINCELQFEPEATVPKESLKDGQKGNYKLDLKIDLILSFPKNGSHTVATVIVEYDGRTHLNDENVRRDKIRDSSVQRQGSTVFRIQSPYRSPDVSCEDYRRLESRELDDHIDNIREHLRVRLFEYIRSLPEAIKALSNK